MFLCNHLYLYCAKHESILMSSALIHYHVDHSRLLTYFSVTSLSNSEIPGSHHLPFICLLVQVQYTCKVVSKLLTHTPWETILSNSMQGLWTAHLTYSQSSLIFKMLYPLLSLRFSHAFFTDLGNFVMFCVHSWESPIS